jgi:hypothetical protein
MTGDSLVPTFKGCPPTAICEDMPGGPPMGVDPQTGEVVPDGTVRHSRDGISEIFLDSEGTWLELVTVIGTGNSDGGAAEEGNGGDGRTHLRQWPASGISHFSVSPIITRIMHMSLLRM